MTMTNNTENNNTVNDFVVVAQPVYLAVITPEGEMLEINTPDGENWYLVDSVSRNATSIDIDDFADYEVVKYQYGELPSQPQPPVVVVDMYDYSGKLHGMSTNVFLAQEKGKESEKEAVMVFQASKTKDVMLIVANEWDEDTYFYGMQYGKTYNTSSKQEVVEFQDEYNSLGNVAEENIMATKNTQTKSKSTEFSVEINSQMDFGEDNNYSFYSLHATKEEKTKTTTKWQSMEVVREYTESSSNEYLWYSFDKETSSKRVINAMEVYIDTEDTFSIVIDAEYNTWKYTGSGSEQTVSVYAQYYDGCFEQKFVIHESNSRKETTTEVTRSFDGETYYESYDTVVYDYRKDKETASGSCFYYNVDDDEYDAYTDFLDGVEEYTGYDIFDEISAFENESMDLLLGMQEESSNLRWDATELALTKGTQTQQYLES